MQVGYIRVSSVDQNIERQLENIHLDKVFIDRISGKDTQRVGFQQMMEYVREGDVLKVHAMDRLARNLDDLRKTVQTLVVKGVRVEFLKENLVFTGEDSPMSILTLSIMGAFAEFERSIIRERQREGIALAKKRGVYEGRGRKPILTDEQVEELKHRVRTGESKVIIARHFRITRQCVYKYLHRSENPVVKPRVTVQAPELALA